MNARISLLGSLMLFAVSACAHRPPEDFAPDPGLLAHIRDIEIRTTQGQVCPGAGIAATYEAVLDDGTHIPFVGTYDKKHPPRLHVVFLERTSPEATSGQDGGWVTYANPTVTASTGFRLTATLRAKPSISHTITVAPDYSCMPHAFSFTGDAGGPTQAGAKGPDVTVRLGVARSPFYDKLLVVGIQAGVAAPFYTLYDLNAVPPADWLVIESRGGHGGPGSPGPRGGDGAAGASGCPAQTGGPGGDGGNGGPGAPGGRGGRITVVVPDDQPFLAGLVDAHSNGGPGGPGGPGGAGGSGGRGGAGTADRNGGRCADAPDGAAGRKGLTGAVGPDGPRQRGAGNDIVTLPAREVFGNELPPDLAQLFTQNRGRRRGDR